MVSHAVNSASHIGSGWKPLASVSTTPGELMRHTERVIPEMITIISVVICLKQTWVCICNANVEKDSVMPCVFEEGAVEVRMKK